MILWARLLSALLCSAEAGHWLTVDDVRLLCDKAVISNQIAVVGNHLLYSFAESKRKGCKKEKR